MKNTTRRGPANGKPLPSLESKSRTPDIERLNAERRRNGLRTLLTVHRINQTELAVRAGLTTPNAIYNFLKGRSASLSLDTVEAILMAFPDLTFEELVGWPRRRLMVAGMDVANAPAKRAVVSRSRRAIETL